MLGLYDTIKDNVTLRKIKDPCTEGVVNRLHFRATVVLFMGCSLLVTWLEWVGDGSKISCVMEGHPDKWTIPENVINTYCYVKTTFTVPKHLDSAIGETAISTGVGDFDKSKDEVTHKAYYQWVPFVLFLQGCLFYMPHLIFKSWEGGKVKGIIAGLNHMIIDRKDRAKKERVLARYVVESLNTHNVWAMKMLFIEFLNLINVIANIMFIDIFLGGEFSTYGFQVVQFLDYPPNEQRHDPMSAIFPRVTKCSFYKFGSSGTVQTHDTVCILPVNIMNEKIYVFLWFWLLLLTLLTVLSLIYHMVHMCAPSLTKSFLRSKSINQKGIIVEEIGRKCEMGDWKLLYLLAKNMEPLVFGEFIKELFSAMYKKEKDGAKKSNGGSSSRRVNGSINRSKEMYVM